MDYRSLARRHEVSHTQIQQCSCRPSVRLRATMTKRCSIKKSSATSPHGRTAHAICTISRRVNRRRLAFRSSYSVPSRSPPHTITSRRRPERPPSTARPAPSQTVARCRANVPTIGRDAPLSVEELHGIPPPHLSRRDSDAASLKNRAPRDRPREGKPSASRGARGDSSDRLRLQRT